MLKIGKKDHNSRKCLRGRRDNFHLQGFFQTIISGVLGDFRTFSMGFFLGGGVSKLPNFTKKSLKTPVRLNNSEQCISSPAEQCHGLMIEPLHPNASPE